MFKNLNICSINVGGDGDEAITLTKRYSVVKTSNEHVLRNSS